MIQLHHLGFQDLHYNNYVYENAGYFYGLLGDVNNDGTIDVLDVILLVGDILGTTFRGAVEWLIENFPELEVERRLQELDKSIHFAK